MSIPHLDNEKIMPLLIEDCKEIKGDITMGFEFYWPSFWAAMAAFIIAYIISLGGCAGLSEAECAAVNGVCSDGGCF